MDLMRMQSEKFMREVKLTVLHRPGGTWSNGEIARLNNGLMTESYSLARLPEHLILRGHFTKERTLEALGGGMAYTATQVTGTKSDDLPFVPRFD